MVFLFDSDILKQQAENIELLEAAAYSRVGKRRQKSNFKVSMESAGS